jgi:hypothetical protein
LEAHARPGSNAMRLTSLCIGVSLAARDSKLFLNVAEVFQTIHKRLRTNPVFLG